ncbi:MAG TPA: Hsp70 family protein, partial [Synergistaceae bacterium]|nr:Hsp70 family protein [Synergistaceae bacterium]
LSLGLETLGGVFTKIIDRNTAIPVSKSQTFTTAADNQTQVEVHVLQGERSMAKDNVSLGKFFLDGIPTAPRGVPQIEVTFNIDVNGILNVTAKDKGTSKTQHITIQSSNLSDEDIEKMKTDAEAHEEEDRKKKEAAELKNEAESLAYQAEKTLKDLGDKVTSEEKSRVESEIASLRSASEGSDPEATKKAVETLTKSLHELSQRLYAAQQDQGEAPSSGASAPEEGSATSEETVDAEFADKDEA